jgi:preprotein translocase SecF subunit
MLNIVQNRRWFYILSGLIILAGLIGMGISMSQFNSPVRLGVDFTSGTLFEVRMQTAAGASLKGDLNTDEVGAVFINAGIQDVRVQRILGTPGNEFRWQVRTNFVTPESALYTTLETGLDSVATEHEAAFDKDFFRTNQQSVSPTIGQEVTTAALIATTVASVLVLGFIWIAFRSVPHSIRYGVCAVIAMVHDILVMIGIFAILGLILGWEADALLLTGLLTVVGYSVQDSIVVFDRIRENTQRHRGEPFEMIVNRSLTETLQRSITTQICVAFVLLALFLMGSGQIRQFVGILLIGLISGTYSSIGIAIPMLVSWERGEIPFINQHARKQKTA